MRAEDIMSSPVVTVEPDTSVKVAAALLATRGFTGAPVVDAHDRLVGIVTEADLALNRIIPDPRAHLRREPVDPAGTPPPGAVGQIMTSPVIARPPTTDVAELAGLMWQHRIRSIPIVDGDRVVGIVTRRDLLRSLARDDSAIETKVRALLAEYGSRSAG